MVIFPVVVAAQRNMIKMHNATPELQKRQVKLMDPKIPHEESECSSEGQRPLV